MDLELFFTSVRKSVFKPALNEGQATGCKAILAAMADQPTSFAAYALATAYHETARAMQPINEIGGNAYFTRMYGILGDRPKLAKEMGNTKPGDGIKYHGRGYVQLTWKDNYHKASSKIGVDLVQNPELALQPENAAQILRHGMVEGWFTGKALAAFLPDRNLATEQQFIQARHVINGSDQAELIASYALDFQSALSAKA